MGRDFKRINQDEMVGGVCSGLAYWIGIPTWIVRMITFVVVFCYGVGFWLYILLWIFVPKWNPDPSDYGKVTSSD